jgi:hypothetical protein
MRHFILAAALTLASGPGLTASITCDKPEYLQLKTADKAELTEEYCRSERTHSLNMDMHKISQESVSKLRSMGADASKATSRSEEGLAAALSCSNAAAQYLGALERRFKMRQRA